MSASSVQRLNHLNWKHFEEVPRCPRQVPEAFLSPCGLPHMMHVGGMQGSPPVPSGCRCVEVIAVFPWPKLPYPVSCSQCSGSVKSSIKCAWTVSVRPGRFSICSVWPSALDLSRMGALLDGGAPFKRDGVPSSVALLNRRSAYFLQTLSGHTVPFQAAVQTHLSQVYHCRVVSWKSSFLSLCNTTLDRRCSGCRGYHSQRRNGVL